MGDPLMSLFHVGFQVGNKVGLGLVADATDLFALLGNFGFGHFVGVVFGFHHTLDMVDGRSIRSAMVKLASRTR